MLVQRGTTRQPASVGVRRSRLREWGHGGPSHREDASLFCHNSLSGYSLGLGQTGDGTTVTNKQGNTAGQPAEYMARFCQKNTSREYKSRFYDFKRINLAYCPGETRPLPSIRSK